LSSTDILDVILHTMCLIFKYFLPTQAMSVNKI
jgi:hypothetical protein